MNRVTVFCNDCVNNYSKLSAHPTSKGSCLRGNVETAYMDVRLNLDRADGLCVHSELAIIFRAASRSLIWLVVAKFLALDIIVTHT
jgi:hypothetical protein